jgi:nucleotide-binding universal stress UspA family protein
MTAEKAVTRRALLCFDGSRDAARAIAVAGELLGSGSATVLTVWEPVAIWEPYDPAAILSAGVSRLAAKDLDLDALVRDAARSTMERGVELARQAGFDAAGHLSSGKVWRAICETAEEIDAAPIVLGARGLSRVQSALLGSVSAAVTAHAKRAVLLIPASAAPSGIDSAGAMRS